MKVIALALLFGLSASCSSGKVAPPPRSKTDDSNPKNPPAVPVPPVVPTTPGGPEIPAVPVTPVVAETPKPSAYVPLHKLSSALLAPPAAMKDLRQGQIEPLIDFTDFLATEREGSGEVEPEACVEAEQKLIGKVQGDKYIIDVSVDLLPCYKAYNDFGVAYKKAESKVYIEYSCDGVDLSSMNGKVLGDFDCKSSSNLLSHSAMSYELEYSVYDEEPGEDEGEEPIVRTETESVTIYKSLATANLEACRVERKGQDLTMAGCEMVRKVVTTLPEASESYVKLVHKDLKWAESKEDTWYGAGSTAVQVNNWKGSVNYKGALLDPEQSLSDGAVTVKDFLPSLNEFAGPIMDGEEGLFLSRSLVKVEEVKAKFKIEKPKRSLKQK